MRWEGLTGLITPHSLLIAIRLSSLRPKQKVALSKDSTTNIHQLPDAAPPFFTWLETTDHGGILASLWRMPNKSFCVLSFIFWNQRTENSTLRSPLVFEHGDSWSSIAHVCTRAHTHISPFINIWLLLLLIEYVYVATLLSINPCSLWPFLKVSVSGFRLEAILPRLSEWPPASYDPL